MGTTSGADQGRERRWPVELITLGVLAGPTGDEPDVVAVARMVAKDTMRLLAAEGYEILAKPGPDEDACYALAQAINRGPDGQDWLDALGWVDAVMETLNERGYEVTRRVSPQVAQPADPDGGK